jgi:protein disulfide-isomerase
MKAIPSVLGALGLLALTGCTSQLGGENVTLNWLTNYEQARSQARTENKMVLMDFTGSDWCGWCMKLKREVFSTQVFKDYADTNLVLLEVDFPRSKPQTTEQKRANEALQQQYQIEGYPTIIVLNPEGKQVGKLGYQPGGPKPFIAALEKLKGR